MSQQISGWGSYYLDYKFLKKIINSLEKGRIADAALFATSVRPEETSDGPQPLLPIDSPGSELQVHKAAFFFRLERELEKIKAFYLQKESELDELLKQLVAFKRTSKELTNLPLFIKIAPDLTAQQEESIAKLVLKHKVDGLIICNTTTDKSNLKDQTFAQQEGGLSGKALEKRSTELISRMVRIVFSVDLSQSTVYEEGLLFEIA